MQVSSHVFIVTGGGSGLGAAVARALVADGAKVVLCDVNVSAGVALAAELGNSARFIQTDVTSEADGKAAVAYALDSFGHLHGLINCAGVAPGEKILGREAPHRLDSFARAVSINLVGTFNMMRLAADAIQKEAPARMANAASSSTPHRWPPMMARLVKPLMPHRRPVWLA